MKKNKNIIIFLVLLSMCVIAILVYKIISIYAVFHSNVGAKAEFRNGAWNIDVNGKKITTGVQTDFTIDQITVAEDQHTMPGKISPGLSGNFKIVINPKDTNVSIRYDITLNQDELKSSNVKISSVEEKNNGAKLIKTAENEYTGIITLQDIQKNVIHEIEMNVEWLDDEQNNESDTLLGTNKDKRQFEIPVTFHATQYWGEEIIPVDNN
mgnify:CR=1 FL=1